MKILIDLKTKSKSVNPTQFTQPKQQQAKLSFHIFPIIHNKVPVSTNYMNITVLKIETQVNEKNDKVDKM